VRSAAAVGHDHDLHVARAVHNFLNKRPSKRLWFLMLRRSGD
jgi:hypothetical protein